MRDVATTPLLLYSEKRESAVEFLKSETQRYQLKIRNKKFETRKSAIVNQHYPSCKA